MKLRWIANKSQFIRLTNVFRCKGNTMGLCRVSAISAARQRGAFLSGRKALRWIWWINHLMSGQRGWMWKCSDLFAMLTMIVVLIKVDKRGREMRARRRNKENDETKRKNENVLIDPIGNCQQRQASAGKIKMRQKWTDSMSWKQNICALNTLNTPVIVLHWCSFRIPKLWSTIKKFGLVAIKKAFLYRLKATFPN